MKRLFFLICFLLTITFSVHAQKQFGERPKLVVGVVVDQMRWDYLSRYFNQMPPGGLKRLINEGYSCNNCLINYIPTVTAIGHTSIYTALVPTRRKDSRRLICFWHRRLVTNSACTPISSPRSLVSATRIVPPFCQPVVVPMLLSGSTTPLAVSSAALTTCRSCQTMPRK